MTARPTTAYARILALSFLAGTAIMAAELAAPRLTAPHLGSTVFSWQAVFAVFLGAIALGGAIGGRLADRARARTPGVLFALAALLVAAAVPLDAWLRSGALGALPHAPRVLLALGIAFAPGALAFGMLGPVLGRAVLAAGGRPGRALGLVGAASAVGSVLGTFVTGFWLLPLAGTRAVVLGAGGLLLLAAPVAWSLPRAARTGAAAPTAEGAGRGPMALACLAGAALLAVEGIAARVAANRLGTSIYTWTSVLGVVLAALAVGNALGGYLADRRDPRTLLPRLLLAASVAVASCLWTPALTAYVVGLDMGWMLRTLLAVAVAFFLPAAMVGTITPVVLRAALADPASDGRTVGRLYAVGTAGALGGALLPALVLVPLLGVQAVIVLLALLLALAPLLLRQRPELPWTGTLVIVAALAVPGVAATRGLATSLGLREDAPGVVVEDSAYFHIRIEDHPTRWVRMRETMDIRYAAHDPTLRAQIGFDAARRLVFWEGPMSDEQGHALQAATLEPGNREAMRTLQVRTHHRVRLLSLDRFVHGFIDIDDPLWLEYEYEILQAALIRDLWPAEGAVRCFFIGGGSYTFQRRLAALHGARAVITTAEIDPAVTRAAVRHLGLEETATQVSMAGDARTLLRTRAAADRYAFVFGDAFHDLGVPWHLTTVEFAREVQARLAPGGIYMINMIDVFRSGLFLGAFVATLEEVFAHVRVVGMGPRDDDVQQTFLLLASEDPLSWGGLHDDADLPLQVVTYDASDLAAVRERAGRRILTDDDAPVESLLAPVVRLRASGGPRRR